MSTSDSSPWESEGFSLGPGESRKVEVPFEHPVPGTGSWWEAPAPKRIDRSEWEWNTEPPAAQRKAKAEARHRAEVEDYRDRASLRPSWGVLGFFAGLCAGVGWAIGYAGAGLGWW